MSHNAMHGPHEDAPLDISGLHFARVRVPRTADRCVAGEREQLEARDRGERVALMVERYANAQDLWTGRPLVGREASNWLALALGASEPHLCDGVAEVFFDVNSAR